MRNLRMLYDTTIKLEEAFTQYKRALGVAKEAIGVFSQTIILKDFYEYLEKPTVEEAPFDDLCIEWGGKIMYHEEIIARMSEKGYLSPDDFLGEKEKPKPPAIKKYEKRECVSVKWSHPDNSKFYFNVGVSLYGRGYGWSARASDGERYFWKRGHYYDTDKKAAFFALSSLLDWIGKPTGRLGKCMRLAIWANREQYDLRQMELFE